VRNFQATVLHTFRNNQPISEIHCICQIRLYTTRSSRPYPSIVTIETQTESIPSCGTFSSSKSGIDVAQLCTPRRDLSSLDTSLIVDLSITLDAAMNVTPASLTSDFGSVRLESTRRWVGQDHCDEMYAMGERLTISLQSRPNSPVAVIFPP